MQIGSGLSWRNEKRLVFFVRSEAAPGGAGIKLSNYSPIGRGGRAVYIILYKMQHNKHVKENKFVFFFFFASAFLSRNHHTRNRLKRATKRESN